MTINAIALARQQQEEGHLALVSARRRAAAASPVLAAKVVDRDPTGGSLQMALPNGGQISSQALTNSSSAVGSLGQLTVRAGGRTSTIARPAS